MGAGDEGDEAVEEDDAELTGAGVAVGVAEDAGAVGDVDLAVEDRLDQALISEGRCWPSASRVTTISAPDSTISR